MTTATASQQKSQRTPPTQPAYPRFPLFDSMRAIAALSIFALHLPFVVRMPTDNPARAYLLELRVGVAVFFLISGFLLYRPFARARYLGQTRPGTVSYAERRTLRIVPAYWVALIGTALLLNKSGGVGQPIAIFSPQGVVSYFGFLQIYDSDTLLGGISAAWTLCVEVTFYAMLPLWALLLRRVRCGSSGEFVRTELLALGGLFVVGATWATIAAIESPPTGAALLDVTNLTPWTWVLPAYLDQFALGMALAVVSVALADRRSQPKAVRVIDRASWLPWLAAACFFFLLAHVDGWFPGDPSAQWIATHELQAIFAFALLLPAVFGNPDRGVVRKLLANRGMLWVGLVSYGVYLWHVAILYRLDRMGALDALGDFWYIAVALFLTLTVAAASFYVVERRALRLGRRLSGRRRSQDADVRMHDLPQHERPEPGSTS
jgi:peptidoglycan/LPS O-acetylase OafA/YrhL